MSGLVDAPAADRAKPGPLRAYATVAGVPVQYGLYTAFAALIAYAVFGTSHQMIQGPSATVAAVSAAVITPLVGAAAIGTNAAVPYAAVLVAVESRGS